MEIEDLARDAGFGFDRIRIDPSVVRGLEYYTGPVFEAELTFETKDEKGNLVRFGSVGGGGRYDGLIGRFRAENTPATGFSIGVSRLYRNTSSPLAHVGDPDIFALVPVNGTPSSLINCATISFFGHRNPTRRVFAVTFRGNRFEASITIVSGPGQHASANL